MGAFISKDEAGGGDDEGQVIGDIIFITEEKLDFSIYSPLDSRDEDEEVLVGPVQHVERCVAQRIDTNIQNGENKESSNDLAFNWGPLSAENLEELMKEANQVATQLERCALQERENANQLQVGEWPKRERTPKVKVQLLHEETESSKSLRSPRRETYVIKDSPIKALLPTIDLGIQSPLASPPAIPMDENTPPPPLCARSSPARPGPSPKTGSGTSLSRKRPPKKSTPSRTPDSMSAKSLPAGFRDSPSRRTSPAVVARTQVASRLSPASPSPRQASRPSQSKAEPVKAIPGHLKTLVDDPLHTSGSKTTSSASTNRPRIKPAGMLGPQSRLPVLSSLPRSSAYLGTRKLPASGYNSLAQVQAGQKGSLLKRSLSSAAANQSRLVPPKKVTLPSTRR
ncbi:proline/serine-rich coiled-coil protein 1-like isoform X2 [Rhinatrema bivittatum]|uniref:proline/serine-rich coiled-coil protein 1-like isoform X2 n=1 Tax=Rhinatrema bivittatum TaxID=194408 RepID=UPI0011278D6D|nr:proline/serine-rich coiled-coil protein 1-like isoform X2 [Rhinatrema bivittatum]